MIKINIRFLFHILCSIVMLCFVACIYITPVFAQQFDYEWPDSIKPNENNVPQPKLDTPKVKQEIKPILLDEPELHDAPITSKNEATLDTVIKEKPRFKDSKKTVNKFKVRQVYDYRSKELPKFFQNAEYTEKNRHLPKVFYQAGYSKLLFDAVKQGDVGAVNTLIERGADINAKDSKYGYTPIMLAAESGFLQMSRYLILRGADLNAPNVVGQTPVHIAALAQNYELFKFMVENGADPYVQDSHNKSALGYLSNNDRVDFITSRLKTQGDKDHALIEFVRDNDVSAAKKTLEMGANVNARDSKGNSPILIATHNDNLDMSSLLLFYGANPTIKNRSGEDAFAYAIKAGNKDLIQVVDTYIIKQELETGVPYKTHPKVHTIKSEPHIYAHPATSSAIEQIEEKSLGDIEAQSIHPVNASGKPKTIIPVELR